MALDKKDKAVVLMLNLFSLFDTTNYGYVLNRLEQTQNWTLLESRCGRRNIS